MFRSILPQKDQSFSDWSFCAYGHLETDSKGRSKQTVRWTVCPAVVFPQKSESTLGMRPLISNGPIPHFYEISKISSNSTFRILLINIISSGYKCRCPTSILATALLVISHPSNCNFIANCSCVSFTLSRSARMFCPIRFSIATFNVQSLLAPIWAQSS